MALRLPSQNKAFRPSKPRPRAPTVNPSGTSKNAAQGPPQPGQKRASVSSGPIVATQEAAASTQDVPDTQATQEAPGLTQGPTQSTQATIIATPHGKSVPLRSPSVAQDQDASGAEPGGKEGEFAVPEPRASTQTLSTQVPSSPVKSQQPIPSPGPSNPGSARSPAQPDPATSASLPNAAPALSTPNRAAFPAKKAGGPPVQRSRPLSTAPSSSSASASKGGRLSLLSAAKQAATSGSAKPSPGRLPSRSRSTSVRAPSVPPAADAAAAGEASISAMPTGTVSTPVLTEASEVPDISNSKDVLLPAEATRIAETPAPVEPAANADTTIAAAPVLPHTASEVPPIGELAVTTRQEEPSAVPNTSTADISSSTDAGSLVAEPAAKSPAPNTGSRTEAARSAEIQVSTRSSSPSAPASPLPASDNVTSSAHTASEPPLTLASATTSAPRSQSIAPEVAPSSIPLFLPDRSPSPSRASAPPATDAGSQAPTSSGRAMSAVETAAAAQAILDSLVLQRNTGRPAPRAEGRRLSPKPRSSPGILITKRAYRDKTVKSQQAARKEAEANGLELPDYLQRKRKLRTRSESTPGDDGAVHHDEAIDTPVTKRGKKNAHAAVANGTTFDEDAVMDEPRQGEVDESAGEDETAPDPAPKKKRGRPKKTVEDEDAPAKEKRPRGRPRKDAEEQVEGGEAAPKEKRPRGRPRKDRVEGAEEAQDGSADAADAEPKEKRPRGRPRKEVNEEELKENWARSRPTGSKSTKEKVLPSFSQVSLVGFEPGETIAEGVDVNLLTMADLATNIFSGQITAKGVQLDEMMQVERSNRRVRGQHNAWNGWTRAQLSRRKVRREQNAERERRRQAIRDEGRDPMGEVTEDEPDSEEEFEVTPNRYTPPPEDERVGRVLPTVLGQQAADLAVEGTPAPGNEDGADENHNQRRRRPEGGEDDEDYEDHDEPQEEYANMGVELRVADDEPEEADGGLAAAGFAVADDEDMGGGAGGGDGDDDDEDFDYDAMQEDGTYDLAQYHAEREAQRERDLADRENRAIIEENDDLAMVNSRTYAKIVPRGMPWTEADMLTMYMALSEVGPNSDIVTGYFPGRTRKQVNRKMVKEQRANPDKFWAAVADKREVDVEHLKISAAYDDHEDWSKEDEFLEQCRRDAEACRDDYVPPAEDEAANEDGLQQMAEENEKHDDKEDDDDYDVAGVAGGEGEDDGERVVIEGYEPEEADDQQDKEDDYDYENEQ